MQNGYAMRPGTNQPIRSVERADELSPHRLLLQDETSVFTFYHETCNIYDHWEVLEGRYAKQICIEGEASNFATVESMTATDLVVELQRDSAVVCRNEKTS